MVGAVSGRYFEDGLALAALDNISIAWHVQVLVFHVGRIETVEGMAEWRKIACLHINEAREAVLNSMVTEALEEVDDVTADFIDVVVCGGTDHRIEGGGSGKGSNDLIRGQHDAWISMAEDIW